jgi:uncharacterized protein (DUF58 family)
MDPARPWLGAPAVVLDAARRRALLRCAARLRAPASALRSGASLARALRGGQEFVAHRPWRAGDDPRALDAAATARAGRPIARELRAEAAQRIACVLDARAGMWVGAPSKWQRACELALVLGACALRARGEFALVLGGGAERSVAGDFAAWHALAARLAARAVEPRDEWLGRAVPRACAGATRVYVVSDFLEAPPQALRALVRPGRELVGICVRAPEELLCGEFAPARLLGAELAWVSPRDGRRRATRADAAELAAVRARLAAHDAALEQAFAGIRARCVRATSAESIEDAARRVGA